MCEECGCNADHVTVERSITESNDAVAAIIAKNLKDLGIMSINILGSPGSGKTTCIEQLAAYLGAELIAVIQGDLESDVDTKRLEKVGIDCFQINTHSGCHLNADMIQKALIQMDLNKKRYLFIENVGNLVCPAGQKIGQHIDMVISSTAEGEDKPKKYPIIFMDAKLVLISKYDLREAVDFDEKKYRKDLTNINSSIRIMTISKKDAGSFKEPAHFIEHERDHILNNHHHH